MNSLFPAKIIHLDLAEGIPGEPLGTDGEPAYIVFFWRGIALGHYHMRADPLPIPKDHLRNLALQTITPAVAAYVLERGFEASLPECPPSDSASVRPDFEALSELKAPLRILDRRPEGDTTSISVVICTRDRAESLDRCLQSLVHCSHAPEEILVVDNCPSCDSTRRLVQRYPQVNYVLEPKPGLDVARNTGITHSGGEVVAFVDDDVTVHPDWIARIAASFSDPKVSAVTGLVLPAELQTEAQVLFEQHWGFNRGYRLLTYDAQYFEKLKSRGVPAWHVGAGANMAFRREAFELVGNFDVRLDVGAAGCSGDSELWYRMLAAGLVCRYDPRVVASHYHRQELRGLRRQIYYYMRGHVAALLVQFAKHRHWGNLVRLFFLLPLYYTKLIMQGICRGFDARRRLIPAECAGCLSGVFFFLRHMNSEKPDDSAPASA